MNPASTTEREPEQQRLVGDRLERWKNAGMSDWVDKNGNNPLTSLTTNASAMCSRFHRKTQQLLVLVTLLPKASDEVTNLSV